MVHTQAWGQPMGRFSYRSLDAGLTRQIIFPYNYFCIYKVSSDVSSFILKFSKFIFWGYWGLNLEVINH